LTLNHGATLVAKNDSPDQRRLQQYLGSYYSAKLWESAKNVVSWMLKINGDMNIE
jgi:hypothetical protein